MENILREMLRHYELDLQELGLTEDRQRKICIMCGPDFMVLFRRLSEEESFTETTSLCEMISKGQIVEPLMG